MRAAAAVLGAGHSPDRPLLVGSVKTNIGHAEAAAGIAGLIKVVLALNHGVIPRHLHFQTPNPHIAWSDIPLAVAATARSWAARAQPRLAGVSAFGASGTNAHLVVQEAPAPVARGQADPDRLVHILALSARTRPALRALAFRYADHLAAHPGQSWPDICFTANAGRAHLPHRTAIVAATAEDAAARLRSATPHRAAAEAPKIAFLFTGQGSHHLGMGERLHATEPRFRRTLDRCAEILRDRMDQPLADVLFTRGGAWLDDTTYAQPALFALQVALADLWRSWGVHPAAVIGHSVGEYAAACVAGVFSLEDGLRLVSRRAELMGRLPAGGAMLAVAADCQTTVAALARHAGTFAVAGENSPAQTVISGAASAIEAALATLAAARIPAARLRVPRAFHSPLMEPVLAEFAREAAAIRYQPPTIPVITNLTGEAATGAIATPDHWVRHLREPVRFADGVAALRRRGCDAFLEIGPARTLLGLARQCLPEDGLLWVPSLRAAGGDWETMLEGLGRLYQRGAAIDWQAFDLDRRRVRLALPTYPWQHESHWRPSRAGPLPAPAAPATSDDDDLLYEVAWRPQDPPAPSADFLPPPGRLAATLQRALDEGASANVAGRYVRALAALEDISADYAALAWRQLGWRFTPGTRCADGELAGRLGVVERHGRLLARTAAILAEAGLLARDGDTWMVPATMPARQNPGDPAERLTGLCADAPAECALLERCGRDLVAVLRGQRDPLELLFPDDGAVTAASLYRDAPGAVLMNRVMQQAVARAVQGLPAGRRLRVLEIGGGTGGTTAALLMALPPGRTDYLFTDISPRFTAAARVQFRDRGWLRCQVLDIERDPAAQGFSHEAPFDIIVAANVLHATRDLRGSLRHVRGLAAPGALFLLLEGTAPIRSVDLVFGLTDGWWRFTDDRVSAAYPLIGTADWIAVLRESGFDDAAAVALDPLRWGVLSRQAVLLARAAETAPPHWLIVADRGGIGRRLAERHRARGGIAALVAPDAEVALPVALDPARPSEVIFLRGLDEPALDPACPEAATEAGRLGCAGAAELVRLLADAPHINRLWLATRGATGGTPAGPLPGLAQAGLWGLARVIAREHPELRPVRIDLDPDADTDMAAAALWDTLCGDADEDEMRFRGGVRAVPRLVRPQPAAPPAPVAFRDDASYLITGGLGGLGLLTARWVVERGARAIVLAGRRDADAGARQACAELEAVGARIVVRQTDIARAADAETLLDAIGRSLPPLRGIVHAAGVLDDGTVRRLDWPRFARVLQPKLAGAWHLHRLTAAMELDFFVLYSSFTAVLGTPGQGNHAAANAFLDALAWHRRGLGLPALSIGWGAWSAVGAAAERDVGARLRKGIGMLAPEQGLRLLERVWRSSQPQVGVVPIGWQHLEPHELRRPLLRDFAATAPVAPSPAAVSPAADVLERWRAAPPERRKSVLVEHILAETAAVLGHRDADEMTPLQGFFELGMDSLTSVELRNRLRAGLGCDLPTTIAFDCPNADALADFLLDRMAGPVGTPTAGTAPAPAATLLKADGLADAFDRRAREHDRRARGVGLMDTPVPESDAQRTRLTRALLALQQMRDRGSTRLSVRRSEPIAVIGIGCRYPGDVHDADGFWRTAPRRHATPSGRSRAIAGMPTPITRPIRRRRARSSRADGGFLDGIDAVRPAFLRHRAARGGLARPAAAAAARGRLGGAGGRRPARRPAARQPDRRVRRHQQQRLRASADGGRPGEHRRLHGLRATPTASPPAGSPIVFGFEGPSLAIDTACSSSLVAVHLACQSLRRGECDLALAGGVNVILTPASASTIRARRMLAPDGRCKTFDAAADGFVRGEGCGLVVLKRLSRAQRRRRSDPRRDPRIGGQPGRPHQRADGAQRSVPAGGDPAGAGAGGRRAVRGRLRRGARHRHRARRPDRAARRSPACSATAAPTGRPLVVGSVKTNIGHLEAAAGIAGLIKVVLAVAERRIPANLHFHAAEPAHRLGRDADRRAARRACRGRRGRGLRVAGVSSFGFGGTNAHVVVAGPAAARAAQVAAVGASAAHSGAVGAVRGGAARAGGALRRSPDAPSRTRHIGDLCWTANAGRAGLPHRLCVAAEFGDRAADQGLAEFRGERRRGGARAGTARGADASRWSRSCSPGRARSTSAWRAGCSRPSRCSGATCCAAPNC